MRGCRINVEEACRRFLDSQMRGLKLTQLEFDEHLIGKRSADHAGASVLFG